MKRILELKVLSEDHHSGLVFARKVKRVAADGRNTLVQSMWKEISEYFKNELEPHFQIEELLIAPHMKMQGEAQLVKRLFYEHHALRQFLISENGRTPKDLLRFAELLVQHIRFEERELFETAQQRLGLQVLSSVVSACREMRKDRIVKGR